MKNGSKSFKPKARLIQILGEHLIKDATVGIIELIKNSYDADATLVEIIMENLNEDNAMVTIRDNGTGMDTEIFLDKWMNPASGHKEEQKVRQKRSKRGRLPLGEKGVGRFAAQQIGNRLSLITKTKQDESELYVNLDWKLFEQSEKYLDEIEINYEEREPEEFGKRESGTILKIFELKQNFTTADIKKISTTLKRMKSPLKGSKDFEINLKFENCPEDFKPYENLEVSDIMEKAHYTLFGVVDNNGIFEYEYKFNVPGEKPRFISNIVNLLNEEGDVDFKPPSICGSFLISLYNYDKSTKWKWLMKSNVSKVDLDDMCGINIFRDGMRILPYGEKGDDWLKLDNRRIQTPSKKISNDTTIGLIEINQVENKLLIDKTNREGLIENSAFLQFRSLVLAVINTLENERLFDRPAKEVKDKKNEEVIKNELKDIKQIINQIGNQLSENNSKDNSSNIKILDNVETKLVDIEKQYDETIDEYNKRNEMLFNLAGTGLAAERFTHEFSKIIDGASRAYSRLQSKVEMKDPEVKKEMVIIRQALEVLRNDIKLLGPMFYIKKVAKEKELFIKNIIDSAISLQHYIMEKERIKYEITGNNFSVMMTEGSCMQIFNNLIDNSVFWLSKKSEIDKRNIKLIMDAKNCTVYVSDSGPGIPERNREKIFEPFVSTKGENGRGLGLYIVKEILESKKWDIFVVNSDDYKGLHDGANFKIVFRSVDDAN